jgi:hypothetical protein
MNDVDTRQRRLWITAGSLLLGYIGLTFAGVSQQPSLMLGDPASEAKDALAASSMTKAFAGGYVEFLATLAFLAGALLLAQLLRTRTVEGEWLASWISGSALAVTAVNLAVGFPAGAAAVYDAHHGAPLATVMAVNDIRNFAFFLSGGLMALFALGVAAAVLTTARLPRWVAYGGIVVGIAYLVTIPAAGSGALNVATLLGFVWVIALAVAALRQARTSAQIAPAVPQHAVA